MRYIDKLRVLKDKSGLKYKEIAEYIGYTEHNTARIFRESNKNIPIEIIIKLCKLFNISLYDLLLEDENIDLINIGTEPQNIYQKKQTQKLSRLEDELLKTTQRLNEAQNELLKVYKEKYEEN